MIHSKLLKKEALAKVGITLSILMPVFMFINFFDAIFLKRQVNITIGILKIIFGVTALSVFFYLFFKKDLESKVKNQYYRALFDNKIYPAFSIDPQGTIVEINDSSVQVIDYQKEELIGHSFYEFIPSAEIEKNKNAFEKILNGETQHYETLLIHKSGHLVEIEVMSTPVFLNRKIIGIVCVAQEITKRKETERRLRHFANTDGLTGIANRRFFEEVLAEEWRLAAEHQQSLSLIMFDIDYFKQYNDEHGHLHGDSCLKIIAEVAQKIADDYQGFAARYGGEEFIVIVPGADVEKGKTIAEKIRQHILHLSLPSEGKRVTISAGVSSLKPAKEKKPEQLLILADQALYEAKKQGRNQVVALHN